MRWSPRAQQAIPSLMGVVQLWMIHSRDHLTQRLSHSTKSQPPHTSRKVWSGLSRRPDEHYP